jgi:hypothetical protein
MDISVPVTTIVRVEYYNSNWNILFANGSVPGHTNLVFVGKVPEPLARLAAISATATHGSFQIGATGTFTADASVDYTEYQSGPPCRYLG